MHRCYVEPSQWHAASIALDAAETHHALRVLRIRDGEPVELFDGRGRTAKAVLRTGAGTRRAASAFAEPVESPRLIAPPPVFITLLQAIPKARRMDLVVEKATELGAMRIIPVRTERVVASPGPWKIASSSQPSGSPVFTSTRSASPAHAIGT